MTSKLVVISAISFTEGGPLTVLRDCLSSASNELPEDWDIIALVHDKSIFDDSRVQYKEFPKAKRSWLARLYYEWVHFYFLSKKIKPDLWFSMHDITPNVIAPKRVVYCHNPSPFFSLPFQYVFLSPKLWLFNLFYKYLYAINISKNNFVVVQQNWIREKFIDFYGPLNIVVAYPNVASVNSSHLYEQRRKDNIFLYPAFPRVFKNFEVVCKAVQRLQLNSINNFEVVLTIDGNENKYSKLIKKRYGHLKNISFIGVQDKKSMDYLYSKAKAVIFPSKMETWGLPITEAKAYDIHLLLADLPYAKETVGSYEKVSFFKPNDEVYLAKLMESIMKNDILHEGNVKRKSKQPFVQSWEDLWGLLIAKL